MVKQSEAIEWIQESVGKEYNPDGKLGLQCKDYANAYSIFLGFRLKAGNACDAWEADQDPFWQKIPFNKAELPQPGDIAVWKPWNKSPYGHIAVILDPALENFKSVDQNWNTSSSGSGSATVVTHSYTEPEIIGYLRPSFDDTTSTQLTVEQRTQAVINFNKQMEMIPQIIGGMTPEQKQQLAKDIQRQKTELGIE